MVSARASATMNVGHSECDPIRVPVERIGPATAQPVPMWNGVEHSPVRLQPNGRPRVSDRLMTDPLSMCTIGTTPRGGLVALDLDTRRRHVHLIGQTGSGKSTLMLNMICPYGHAEAGTVVADAELRRTRNNWILRVKRGFAKAQVTAV